MQKRTIKLVGYLLIFISAVTAVGLAIALKPTSGMVLTLTGAWMIIPYLLFAYFVNIGATTFHRTVQIVLITCFCCLGGIYRIVDAMYIHSDPQGGFVVLFTPFLQLVAFAILFFVVSVYNRFFGKLDKA